MNDLIEIPENNSPRDVPNYTDIIEDLRAVMGTAENNARMSIIEGYHEAGLLINEYGLNKPQYLSQVAQDLGKSKRTIYRVLQFVEMFPDLSKLPEGLDTSWHKICNKYLAGKSKEDEGEFLPSQDDIIRYIWSNANYLASKVQFTKSGLTVRITREQFEAFMEKE